MPPGGGHACDVSTKGNIMTFVKTYLPRLVVVAAILALIVTLGTNLRAQAGDDKEAASASASLDKAEVEKIIEEYLMANGKVIMDAVEAYQRKDIQDRSAAGIANNKEALFNDDQAHFLGNKDGDVTVVEFFDYNCGYCKRVLPDIQALVEADKNVKVVLIDFPILGPTSETAARWALAAGKQDKYFEYHRALMEHQGQISEDALREMAKTVGLDVDKAATDANSTETTLHIEKNRKLGQDVGITGTPAFIVGDQLLPGAVPVAQMKAAVEGVRSKKAE